MSHKRSPFVIPFENPDFFNAYRNAHATFFGSQAELLGTQQNHLWRSSLGKQMKKNTGDIQVKGTMCHKIVSYFKKFCSTTSLHGWHYIVEQDKSILERIFWILTLCIVYSCCTLFIVQSVIHFWTSKPVIAMENTPTAVGNIPFPAVTICSSNQVKPSVFNISSYYMLNEEDKQNLSEGFYSKLDYASVVCNANFYDGSKDHIDLETFQHMFHNAPLSCEEIFVTVKWTNETLENPCEYIQTVITDLGVCYTFNMLPLKVLFSNYYFDVIRVYKNVHSFSEWARLERASWTPDKDYGGTPVSTTDVPRRIAGIGTSHAVTMVLNLAKGFDKHCNGGGQGLMVLVHNPAQIPSSANAKLGIKESSIDWLMLNPRRLRTSADMAGWDAQERGCYFDHERGLYFFDIYTQSNCDLECESNYSLRICGCVPYYHPRALFTPICSHRRMQDCVEDALTKYVRMSASKDVGCDCLPSCSTLDYESAAMSIDVVSSGIINDEEELTDNVKNQQHSTVVITYQSKDIIGTVRRSLYGFSDFLGTIGGIMGLFLGFSWISLLEVIYFVSFHPLRRDIHQGNRQ